MTITVYIKPECVQCHYTETLLEKLHLVFTARDVTTDDEAAREARTLGRELGLQLPFVVVTHAHLPTQRWAGFCIDKIRGLKGDDR